MLFGSEYVYAESDEEDEKEEVNAEIKRENGQQNSQHGDSQTQTPQEASSGLPVPYVERLLESLPSASASAAAAECTHAELLSVAEPADDCDSADSPEESENAAYYDRAKWSKTSTAAAEYDRKEPSMESKVGAADGNHANLLTVLEAATAASSELLVQSAAPSATIACDRDELSASAARMADSNQTDLSAKSAATELGDESHNVEIVGSESAPSPNVVSSQPDNKESAANMSSRTSRNAEPDRSDNAQRVVPRPSREANTNIVCIQFFELVSPVNMHTGEPVRCTNCSVILSHQSSVAELPDGTHAWQCEFCDHCNQLDINPQEQPRTNDVTYMISPPPQLSCNAKQPTDMMIIFCVDISGSMSTTTEVPGRLKLKGRQVLNNYRRFVQAGDGNQTLPRAHTNVTNVTRLETVQTAIEQQLSDLARGSPTTRAAIIAFNHEVTYLGDGNCEPVTIAEHNLLNRELLVQAGESVPLPGLVRDTHANLSTKLFQLEECGRTALGPALVMAIALAGRARVSNVVLCTDGLANVGLGSFEAETSGTESETQNQNSAAFYEDIGRVAAEKGVSVSILTIQGTTCNLAQLSAVAQHTNGEVKTVDPMKLSEEFSNVVNDDILATNATATFLVHKSLYIEGEDNEATIKRVQHGNVRSNSQITFQFGVKKQYRRVLREQLRVSAAAAAAAPDNAATAGAFAVSAHADSDDTTRGSNDDHETVENLAMETEHPRSNGTDQKTLVADQAAPSTQEESTAALRSTASGSAVPAEDAPLLTLSQSSLSSEFCPMEDVQLAAAAAPSSSAVAVATQEAPETMGWHRCNQSTDAAAVPCSAVAGAMPEAPEAVTSSDSQSNPSTTTQHEVCFQIQVEYTDRDGGRALRVLTAKRPLTADRLLTERTMNGSVICSHSWRGAGRAFLSSRNSEGMEILHSGERLLSRSARNRCLWEGFSHSVRTAHSYGFHRLRDDHSSEIYGHMTRSARAYERGYRFH